MSTQTNPASAPVTIATLLSRQLADWQTLLAQLKADRAPAPQFAYCQAQIERLQGELDALKK